MRTRILERPPHTPADSIADARASRQHTQLALDRLTRPSQPYQRDRRRLVARPREDSTTAMRRQTCMRIATVYFVTDRRLPGVSPAGMASRAASPRR